MTAAAGPDAPAVSAGPRRVLFVTGRLAEPALRRVLEEMAPPFAYDVASLSDLTAHERELLATLGPLESVFVEGTGYLGWRAGIRPDGSWVFFVAGD